MDYDYEEIHNLVKRSVLNTKRYYATDRLIGKYMHLLKKAFKYDEENIHDLMQDITIHLLTPGERGGRTPMKFYDPERAGLYTFVNLQVYGYVCRLVRNLFTKKKLNVVEINESDIGEEDYNIFDHLYDDSATPEEMLILKEEYEELGKEYGQDFVDIIFKNKTQTEIADELDMSRAGVSYRYNRDLKKAREKDK